MHSTVAGVVQVIEYANGAVRLPRLTPGHNVGSLSPCMLGDPAVIARRLRIYEELLECDADRALKWAFATTVLGILWPVDPIVGMDLRAPFALAAQSMSRLLE